MTRLAITASLLALFCAACDGGGEPPAPDATASSLTGTVTYRERMALPPGSTVEVRLEDVSRVDAPSVLVAQQAIAMDGRQVPVAFELAYEPASIERSRVYSVRATIRAVDGALLFTSTQANRPFVDGQPGPPLEIVVQRAAGAAGGDAPVTGADAGSAEPAAPSGSIAAGPWRLSSIRRPDGSEQAVSGEASYTIEFGADGRYGGLAHCNRYTGGYEIAEPGKLAMSPGAATLIACPDPSLAAEFLRAVTAATGYETSGDSLRLQVGGGGLLVFTREGGGPQATAQPGRTFVFDCDGDLSFTVRSGPGEVAVWAPAALGGRYAILARTPAASGARYQTEDVVFWDRGDVATFELGDRRFVDCRSNAAKVPWADAARRGAIFRAVGNEPAWHVEVFADRFVVVTDLGARSIEVTDARAVEAGGVTTWRAAAAVPSLQVSRRACADTMSGDVFEGTAMVTLEDRMLHGCGRYL